MDDYVRGRCFAAAITHQYDFSCCEVKHQIVADVWTPQIMLTLIP